MWHSRRYLCWNCRQVMITDYRKTPRPLYEVCGACALDLDGRATTLMRGEMFEVQNEERRMNQFEPGRPSRLLSFIVLVALVALIVAIVKLS